MNKPCLLTLLATVFGLGLAGQLPARTFKTLHSFTGGTDGGGPQAALLSSGEALYGTAFYNGSGNRGTIYKINSDGTGFTVIYAFTPSTASGPLFTNRDGGGPHGDLILFSNTLYGTANSAGPGGNGTVFAVSTDGTSFRTLHAFDGVTDSGHPVGRLVVSGNTLYGVTQGGVHQDGVSTDYGSVFSVNTDGSGFSTLYSFSGGDGWDPQSGLVLSGNPLYGSTSLGGNAGNLFALNTDGTGFIVLYSFSGAADGSNPLGELLLVGNTLYGTTGYGGTSGNGTVFSVQTDGTEFTNLYSFKSLSSAAPNGTNNDGATPHAGLLLLTSTLYGTTWFGGNSGHGTIFAINTNGTGFINLHNFAGGLEGANPLAGLISSGATLYGTSSSYSSTKLGSVFNLSFSPQLTITPATENVVLTWPTNFTGFTLQSTTNLGSPAIWTTNLPAPVVVNGQNTVTNPISDAQQFFRLSP